MQPHHLQRMQRGIAEQVEQERRLGWAYPYGLVEARLSRDELENFRVRFDKLRLIMPSGLEVSFPENAELPSLDIKQVFARGAGSFSVSIGVPLWQNTRANTLNGAHGGDSRVKLIYRVAEIECADENTGENPKPIQVRKINARLMFENEDASDMEVLPLLRIVRGPGDLPRQDPEFIAPCLVLGGSPTLREMVRDLANHVEAKRIEQVAGLTGGGLNLESLRPMQFVQMLKLATLNRFSVRLPALNAPSVPPFEIYIQLRELMAELAALDPNLDKFAAAPYNHENPFPCFSDLIAEIRKALEARGGGGFKQVPFAESNGVLTAKLGDDDISGPNAYFLGVMTRVEATTLERFIDTPDNPNTPDKFKLMPTSLVTRAVRGIVLKTERHPPVQLPTPPNLHYFRLDCAASARMWEQVKTEKSASLRWTGEGVDLSDATFALYMTIPKT